MIFHVCSRMHVTMSHLSSSPSHLSALLRHCSLPIAKSIHAHILKHPLLSLSTFLSNRLISFYNTSSLYSPALRLFVEMHNRTTPNAVTVTTMMSGLLAAGRPAAALHLFVQMHNRTIPADEVSASCALNACARHNPDNPGPMVHALVIKKAFDADRHVGNSMIDMYAKRGSIVDAQKVFVTMCESGRGSAVSWNALIAGFGRSGDGRKGLEMVDSMRRSGFEPDDVTYVGLLGSCNECGDAATAREVFNRITSPSIASWNAVISGYCQEGRYGSSIELFRRMQFRSVLPDRTTLAVVLRVCSGLGNLGFGKQVHGAAVRVLLRDDMFVASGLVDMYSKCGQIRSARQVFDRMNVRDVVCWNSMIGGFAVHSLSNEAFSLFGLMRAEGVVPTQFSYASVINSCASMSSLPQGRQMHAEVAKNGYDADVYVGSALIDMYFKCGNVDEAQQFFECMPMRNTVSWNEMINGYAQNGLGERAIGVFEQMLRAKEKPDGVTFISVLNACSHSGLVDEGIEFLESMEKDYGIEPLVNHYTCVVDSLGRAGRLTEAEKLVDKMKWKGDPIVWEVLLGSCALHGDARLGRRAAEELFRINPNDSAPYVLLSNIYAGLGRWKDASEVRTLMSGHKVVKSRGYSWLDQKDCVRTFMVDDG